MTNGSVGQGSSDASKGVQMVVAYQGGQRQITVSSKTPVTVLSNGTMDQVKAGAKVVVGYVPGPYNPVPAKEVFDSARWI